MTEISAVEEATFQTEPSSVSKLSEEEKILLVDSWKQLEQDADKIGTVTFMAFMKLFDKHPEVRSEFTVFQSVKEADMEEYNRTLRNHGLRVLSTVAKMIHRVNEEEKMIAVVRATGTRHGKYNTNALLIDVICQHFVSAISETIGEKWTAELETAYNHLFAILSFNMKEALLVEQQKNTL